jgi:hypothetical protein
MSKMSYSDFVILLARQRSGTNALRSVLGMHQQITCLPEVFDTYMTDYQIGRGASAFRSHEVSYFNFLEKHIGNEVRKWALSGDRAGVFLDFLDYLRCFSEKKYIVVDVKYMSTHHVSTNWRFISDEPYLFSMVKEHNLRVVNITRRNLLRYYLSELKAQHSGRWHEFDETVVGNQQWYIMRKKQSSRVRDQSVYVDVEDLLQTLLLCHKENDIVEISFADYENYLTFDYDDMFSSVGAPLSDCVLDRISQWLSVENDFPQAKPEYKKQSHLTLEETISNYEEVVEALRGTEFEYCLEDEKMYHKSDGR